MGKVTETMLREFNHKLYPWKCFSVLLEKRTLDAYCEQAKDVLFWLPGLNCLLN